MKRTLLIFSQVYPPDPASVGQHMADVAVEMAKRGWRVRVITANRGYDDASVKYAPFEMRDGVEVRRVPLSSFGKQYFVLRALAMLLFMAQCLWAGMTTRGLARILVSTSPPMCGFAAAIIHVFRRVPLVYWVMDLNPDQMIELGKMRADSLAAKVLNWLQRFTLKRSENVIALDRFMAPRLLAKVDTRSREDLNRRMTVMPPWPHEDVLEVVAHPDNWFRERHELQDRFVFMYSGNHSNSSPVTTVLDAAVQMNDQAIAQKAMFMFIGGGHGKKEVDDVVSRRKPANVRSLPYQPLKDLRFSLSAADVHIVTVGNDVVGVVHPCKIYGAMAVARPILLVGPDPCHASDIVRDNEIGWHISHGDVDSALATIQKILDTSRDELAAMGSRAQEFVRTTVSKEVLCNRFCDIVEGKKAEEVNHSSRPS